jgi:rubrerythrin
MPILTPTKADGATAKPLPMLYVDPACQIDDDTLAEQMPLEGVNSAFVADLLSSMLAHERCGTHLYRSVAGRTQNPMLKQRYEHFGEETARHVDILEQLVLELGGNPNYVSAMGRATEGADSRLLESTFMLSGAVDPITAEMAMLDAVFLAESIDHANWQTLAELVASFPEGPGRDAFQRALDEVRQQEDEHLEWARSTRARLVDLQARSTLPAEAGTTDEPILAHIRHWFET